MTKSSLVISATSAQSLSTNDSKDISFAAQSSVANPATGNGVNGGVIAGVVTGIVVLLAVVGIIAYRYRRNSVSGGNIYPKAGLPFFQTYRPGPPQYINPTIIPHPQQVYYPPVTHAPVGMRGIYVPRTAPRSPGKSVGFGEVHVATMR